MKIQYALLTVVLTAVSHAAPSANCFSAVTNDWYRGNFSNVYELAQMRLSSNSNDVVAAYLMHDWNLAFGYAKDISNCLNRVIHSSDIVTNQGFATVFRRMRPAYVEYQNEFLPTLTDEAMDAERYKAFRSGRMMTSVYLLRLMDEEGLW